MDNPTRMDDLEVPRGTPHFRKPHINCRDPSLSHTHDHQCKDPAPLLPAPRSKKGASQITSKQTYDRQVPMLDMHVKLRNLRMSCNGRQHPRPLHVHKTRHTHIESEWKG